MTYQGRLTFILLIAVSPAFGGKSKFEQIIEKNGGKIPFPFEELLSVVRGGANHFTTATAKHSRSMQAAPRDLASASFRDGQEVLIAKSKNGNTIEIISTSREKPYLKFQVIENYREGQRLKVEDADTDTCFDCHQGGQPHLTPAPWREIESSDIGAFDHSVRAAAEYKRNKTACDLLCGKDLECRRQLVISALTHQKRNHSLGFTKPVLTTNSFITVVFDLKKDHGKVDPLPFSSDFEKRILKNWPKDNFSWPSTVIPDTDPKTKEGFTLHHPKTGKDLTYELEFFRNLEDQEGPWTHLEERKMAKTKALDPSHPRPRVRSISKDNALLFAEYISATCFDLDWTNDYSKLHNYSIEEISEAASKPNVLQLLKKGLPSREDLLKAFRFNLELSKKETSKKKTH